MPRLQTRPAPDHDAPVPDRLKPAVMKTALLGQHDDGLCREDNGCQCFCTDCFDPKKPGCVCTNCGCATTTG